MHNYSKKYVVARNTTYTCFVIEAMCFGGRAYFGGPITLVWWLFGAAIVGIPACLAYYYYDGMRGEDSDMPIVAAETLEKTEEEDPNLGEELADEKSQQK